jgi:nucleoside-triphosphatase THEP1
MRIATVVYEAGQSERADRLLAEVAQSLRASGLRLAGSIQRNAGTNCAMDLEDLASGQRLNASLPAVGSGCRLDASALEDAAGLAAVSIGAGVDLVIVNRFGKEELAGRGFRPIIEAAISHDLPVLTSVNRAHKDIFASFAGDCAVSLPLDLTAVEAWCRAGNPAWS